MESIMNKRIRNLEDSMSTLESFRDSIGGLNQFYVIALHDKEIRLQGLYTTELIKSIKAVFAPELMEQKAEFILSSSAYLTVSFMYNSCCIDITLTD